MRQELGDIWKKNKAEQDARKARRKAELEMEGTAGQRARAFLARWLKRLFYTAFAAMAVYLLVMVVTLSIPLFVSVPGLHPGQRGGDHAHGVLRAVLRAVVLRVVAVRGQGHLAGLREGHAGHGEAEAGAIGAGGLTGLRPAPGRMRVKTGKQNQQEGAAFYGSGL